MKPFVYKREGLWWVSLCGREYANPRFSSNHHFRSYEQALAWALYPNERPPYERRPKRLYSPV